MQHQINAPHAGVVTELAVRAGEQVDVGAVLAVVDHRRRRPRELHRDHEQLALRRAAAELGARYGYAYTQPKLKAGEHTDELWREAGKLGLLGVNLPEDFGGGGAGMYELALVWRS